MDINSKPGVKSILLNGAQTQIIIYYNFFVMEIQSYSMFELSSEQLN